MEYVQSKEGRVNIDGVCKRKNARQAIEVESTFCWSSLFEVGLTRAPSFMGVCVCVFVPSMATWVKSTTLPNT